VNLGLSGSVMFGAVGLAFSVDTSGAFLLEGDLRKVLSIGVELDLALNNRKNFGA